MSRSLRTVILALVDVLLAGFCAVVFWMNVGVSGQSDTNPPTCTTANGTEISCSLEGPLRVAQLLIFVVVLAGLAWFQVRRGRRSQVQSVHEGH